MHTYVNVAYDGMGEENVCMEVLSSIDYKYH